MWRPSEDGHAHRLGLAQEPGAGAGVVGEPGEDGSEPLLPEREEQYGHIQRSLVRFRYRKLMRAEQGLVLEYLWRMTGLSPSQVTKLVGRSQREEQLRDRRRRGRPFASKYTRADIAALAEPDGEHGRLSGPATRKLCQRAWEVYGDVRYELLAGISNGHVYNLRKTVAYRRRLASVEPTRPRQVAIGERRKPRPEGRPGCVRVDTVHQGDLDGVKGVYHINAVDEVTQCQAVGSVETISERHMLPVLEQLLAAFPFCPPGLSLRQRLGVCQLPRGQAAGEAAGGVHQVAAAAQH